MIFADIQIGHKYWIEYRDPNYPCHCQCHSNPNIRHCMPCCHDYSYYGEGVCIEKDIHTEDIFMDIGRWTACFKSYDIVREIEMEPKYPNVNVQLVGADGNAFFIIAKVTAAMSKAKIPKEEIDAFRVEATSGDYDNLLRTVCKWVSIR